MAAMSLFDFSAQILSPAPLYLCSKSELEQTAIFLKIADKPVTGTWSIKSLVYAKSVLVSVSDMLVICIVGCVVLAIYAEWC